MMKSIFLFLAMIYMHIFDDFYLQGVLAKMKQKDWWREQKNYNDFYKNDYLTALLIHALSWSISINIPVAFYIYFIGRMHDISMIAFFILEFMINFFIHCFIDDLKANQKAITLEKDQSYHMAQILCTFLLIIILQLR